MINQAPQNSITNRNGAWSKLEQKIVHFVKTLNAEVAVMTGVSDASYELNLTSGTIKVPNYFWKLVCWTKQKEFYVTGFKVYNKEPVRTDFSDLTQYNQEDFQGELKKLKWSQKGKKNVKLDNLEWFNVANALQLPWVASCSNANHRIIRFH
jgi:DNA/RNA endonuclease G (NUC1)